MVVVVIRVIVIIKLSHTPKTDKEWNGKPRCRVTVVHDINLIVIMIIVDCTCTFRNIRNHGMRMFGIIGILIQRNRQVGPTDPTGLGAFC